MGKKGARRDSPVATPFIVPRAVAVARVSAVPGREIPRWSVVDPAIVVGPRWRREIPPVRVVVTATAIVIHGPPGWRSVSPSTVVEVIRWRRRPAARTPLTIAIAVRITAGAVATRRTTAVIIVIIQWRHGWTTARRSRSRTIASWHVWLGLLESLASGSGLCKPAALTERTSAIQVTGVPLNSRLSSFSTAVRRSAAVSNSTNLGQQQWLADMTRTDCTRRLRTNPRPVPSRPVSEYTTSRLDCRAKSFRSYFQKSV
jgi:hypothetical protein